MNTIINANCLKICYPIFLLFFIQLYSSTLWAQSVGLDWVRNHDFMASAIVLDSDNLDVYKNTGLNVLLGWKHREIIYEYASIYSIPWMINAIRKRKVSDYTPQQIEALMNEDKNRASYFINTYPGSEALLVWDEPKPNEMSYLNSAVQWAKQTHPSKLVYSNLNAYNVYSEIGYDYSDHVTDVINTGVDIISVDAYPYFDDLTQTSRYIKDRYFATLESVRRRAVNAGIPYWLFVQSTDENAYRLPSQSDLRMNLFTALAYGFTGIQYYLYWHPNSNNIIESNGNNNTIFNHYVTDAMSEVAYLGRTLKYLKSKNVWHIRSQSSNVLPWGTVEFTATQEHPVGRIAGIDINNKGPSNNGLIGFFEDDYQHNYFMLVNTKRAKNTLAWDTRLDFTIYLGSSVKSLYKVNRDSGLVEEVPIVNGVASITILGGTGELFKIDSASFVGASH